MTAVYSGSLVLITTAPFLPTLSGGGGVEGAVQDLTDLEDSERTSKVV